MSKAWQAYARHILDTIEKIRRIQQRGDLTRDDILYDATLRNMQTLSEATQRLPGDQRGKKLIQFNYLFASSPLFLFISACVRFV